MHRAPWTEGHLWVAKWAADGSWRVFCHGRGTAHHAIGPVCIHVFRPSPVGCKQPTSVPSALLRVLCKHVKPTKNFHNENKKRTLMCCRPGNDPLFINWIASRATDRLRESTTQFNELKFVKQRKTNLKVVQMNGWNRNLYYIGENVNEM